MLILFHFKQLKEPLSESLNVSIIQPFWILLKNTQLSYENIEDTLIDLTNKIVKLI